MGLFCSKLFRQALLGVGLMSLSTVVAADKVKWSMATSWGGGPILEEAAKGFASRAAELSAGDIEIEVFPGGTLGKALKYSDTVKKGVAQAGHGWAGYDWGIDKTNVLFANFAGGLDTEKMLHWLYQGGGLELYQEFRREKHDVHAMPCGIMPREGGLFSNKKVQTLEDFKGLKLRTAGAWAEIAGELGASTVILPGAEVYAALERGVIDATEWAQLSVNKSLGFHKIAKYIILPGVHQPNAVLECAFNTSEWENLTDLQKSIIDAAAKLTTLDFLTKLGHDDTAAYEFYKSEGVEIINLDQAFVDEAMAKSIAWAETQAAENEWFKKVWDHQKAYREAWANAPDYR